jgi:Ca2+-binding EF-hand superfamily protein
MLGIFEDYRKSQWPQELPSRVLKEILKATDINKDDKISVEELNHLLERIGASDKMSMTELADVMAELGVKDDKVDIKVLKEKLAEKERMHYVTEREKCTR